MLCPIEEDMEEDVQEFLEEHKKKEIKEYLAELIDNDGVEVIAFEEGQKVDVLVEVDGEEVYNESVSVDDIASWEFFKEQEGSDEYLRNYPENLNEKYQDIFDNVYWDDTTSPDFSGSSAPFFLKAIGGMVVGQRVTGDVEMTYEIELSDGKFDLKKLSKFPVSTYEFEWHPNNELDEFNANSMIYDGKVISGEVAEFSADNKPLYWASEELDEYEALWQG